MSLNRGKLNPLSVLGMRKLNFIPEHFSKINIKKSIDIKLLDNWINFNLNSRYAIVSNIVVNQDKKMMEILEVGLEDPKEITMLTLGCPHLYK